MGSTTPACSTLPGGIAGGIEDLWAAYKQSADPALRNRLIIHYSPFVKRVANRLWLSLPRHFDGEDLVGYGIIGLIDAIERFDPNLNVKFETYAMPRIRGAIIDELRSTDWVPRSVRTKARAFEQAHANFEALRSRKPTTAEMAEELHMTGAELQSALRKISQVGVLALDESVRRAGRSERSTLGEALADRSAGPMETFENKETNEELARALNRMPERERTVLALHYYKGMTLLQIGGILGVTESRVCQINTKALRRLRLQLADRPGRMYRFGAGSAAQVQQWAHPDPADRQSARALAS
ncbi:MAG TPA: FliA/WhiG family RNA polymerase sigma factor [Acidimicrobiales bacterium]|nr:FliA/WhiG family RNA polymerase sigma factor [Acidimicrobiales bacterium]